MGVAGCGVREQLAYKVRIKVDRITPQRSEKSTSFPQSHLPLPHLHHHHSLPLSSLRPWTLRRRARATTSPCRTSPLKPTPTPTPTKIIPRPTTSPLPNSTRSRTPLLILRRLPERGSTLPTRCGKNSHLAIVMSTASTGPTCPGHRGRGGRSSRATTRPRGS